MAKRITINVIPQYPVVEEYEKTFRDFQQADDQTRWIGMGFTGELPHNPGSLEEEIDEEQRRIAIDRINGRLKGGGRGY